MERRYSLTIRLSWADPRAKMGFITPHTNSILIGREFKMEKNQRLHRIYRYYQEVVAEYAIICHKGCAHCCTRNVTLTSLEGRDLLSHMRALKASRQTLLVQKLIQGYTAERFHPQVTLNRTENQYANQRTRTHKSGA